MPSLSRRSRVDSTMPQMPPQGGAMPDYAAMAQGGYMPQMPMPPYGYPPYPPYGYDPSAMPRVVNTQLPDMSHINLADKLGKEQAQNLDLIMSVPLEVTVEIGRTRRKVQEILSFSKGSLVVLDKLAGDQVDLFVNGKCIARGDVVVIDDNFGIRITEILQNSDLAGLVSK